MKLKTGKVSLNLGFLEIDGTWEVNDIQRKAAWEMYVELVTRISVVKLQHTEGILREVLNSLYSIFTSTRKILKTYGADIATPVTPNSTTFGHIAVNILNQILRPFLSKWHPLLSEYEAKKTNDISISEHEKKWHKSDELRSDLDKIRQSLIEYCNLLGQVCNIPSLLKL